MKLKIVLFFAILSLLNCKKPENQSEKDWVTISDRVSYTKNQDFFEFKSGKFTRKIPNSKLPYRKIVLLNASLVGYFTALDSEGKIVGISSPEYVYSEKVLNLLKENKIQNVGNEQKYDVEKILSLKPDAIFTNHIEAFENTYAILKKNGIEVIFIDEYLEQKPLEKAKIIELFGQLLGNSEKAELVYNDIEKNYNTYQSEASKISKKPIVLANEMYGNQWFLPGGKTFVANYIKDAAADYILSKNTDEKAVPMSFEEVFVKAEKAEYWINVGNHQTKSELLAINPNYAKMKVFQTGKLYSVTAKEKGKSNDFFESGVVRADLVLKDYIKIFHTELFPEYSLTYMKELK